MSSTKDSSVKRVTSLSAAVEVMADGGQAFFDLPKGKGQVVVGATGQDSMPPNIDEEEEEPAKVASAPDEDNWLK